MVRGCGSALLNQCVLVSVGNSFARVSYTKSWKVYGGLASHGSAKTQRGD